MANWYGMCRSNYIKVKSEEEFRNLLGLFKAQIIEHELEDGTKLFGFYSLEEFGEEPILHESEFDAAKEAILKRITGLAWPEEFEEPLAITDVISSVLAEGQVMVVMEVGSQKAVYLSGFASAVHSSGERINIDLEDVIRSRAVDMWSVPAEGLTPSF